MGHSEHWAEPQRAKLSELESKVNWREIQTTSRHPKLLPILLDTHPLSISCLTGLGTPGVLVTVFCVPSFAAPKGYHHLDAGTCLAFHALEWPSVLSLPPDLVPQCLQQGPPSWVPHVTIT